MSKLKSITPQPQQGGGYSTPAVIRRNQEEPPAPLTVNQKEAARMFGLSERPFKKLAEKYKIPCLTIGRRRLYSRSVLKRCIDAGTNPAAETESKND